MTLMSNVVKTLHKVTGSLGFQTSCTLHHFVKDSGIGDPQTKSTKYTDVVVVRKQRQVPTASGNFVVSSASVIFLRGDVDVSERDTITLADGSGGLVVSTSNPIDASGRLITEAYLG